MPVVLRVVFGFLVGILLTLQITFIGATGNPDWAPSRPSAGLIVVLGIVVTAVVLMRKTRTIREVALRGFLIGVFQWVAVLPISVAFALGRYVRADDQSMASLIGYLGAAIAFGLICAAVGGGGCLASFYGVKRIRAEQSVEGGG